MQNAMQKKILDYMTKYNMLKDCSSIVMGLSGGADSVCLLLVLEEVCKKRGIKLKAVHVHHGIRGAEADEDLKFCREICHKMNIDFKEYYFDVPEYARKNGVTCEEAGRSLRYQAFYDEANSAGAKIAVAHHMNDQAETVIFNLCRGSGIRGIRGMLPVRDKIIRPLLCCSRSEIESYLAEMGQEFKTDSTNNDNDYSRNKIRHEILPFLEANINSKAVKNIAALADKAGDAETYLEKLTEKKFLDNSIIKSDSVLLMGLEKEDNYMAKRIIMRAISELTDSLKDFTDIHIESVAALIEAHSGVGADLRAGLFAKKMQDGIYIYYKNDNEATKSIEAAVIIPGSVDVAGGSFRFTLIDRTKENFSLEKILNEPYTKYLDYDKIKSGLQLRGRRPGDCIAIDGGQGTIHHKKLKQYFIDEKIPIRDRDELILLADKSEIVWVVGRRIGANYKVTKDTDIILKIEFLGDTYE